MPPACWPDCLPGASIRDSASTASSAIPKPEMQAFRPDEIAKLQAVGTSLAGRIAIGAGTAALFRRPVGRLWPEITALPDFRFAVDGYLVHDGRFRIGEGDDARILAGRFRANPASFVAG